MNLPKYIHGPTDSLPKTLAGRVSYIRNARGIHMLELSKHARVPIETLEEIEAGIETWLPVAVRQRIARVLKVDPKVLEEVEKEMDLATFPKEPSQKNLKRLRQDIMRQVKNLKCPICNSPLKSWVQEGFDLKDHPIQSPKAHCTKCVFQLKD